MSYQSLLRDLCVDRVEISSIRPNPHNARTHTPQQIRQVAESIRTFKWMSPILVDAEYEIIAGHARYEAAKLLGLSRMPVIRIADLTEAQKRAYIIADNRLAELAGWDFELVKASSSSLLSARSTSISK